MKTFNPTKESDLIELLYLKFDEKISQLCFNNLAFQIVLETKGTYEILKKTSEILIKKYPKYIEHLYEEKNDHLVLRIVKNLMLNHSRDKSIKKCIDYSFSKIDISKLNESSIPDPIYMEDNLFQRKNENQIERLLKITEKLYSLLNKGQLYEVDNLVRYYRKVAHSIKDVNVKILYESNLDLFYAAYYFEAGKLNISKKYAFKSIQLYNQCNEILGYSFISNAFNILGLIELNQSNYNNGKNIFLNNIQNLERDLKLNRLEISRTILAKTRIQLGMFSGNIPTISPETFKDSLEIDLPKTYSLYKTYVKTYLYIDKSNFDKANEIISAIKEDGKDFDWNSTLNKVRLYIATAEGLSLGFTSESKQNKEMIFIYCQKAEEGNIMLCNSYFDSMIKILKGYSTSDIILIRRGIEQLKKRGYIHYSNWYKKKFFT